MAIGYIAVDVEGLHKIVYGCPIFHLEHHAQRWIEAEHPERLNVTYGIDCMPSGQTYNFQIKAYVVGKIEYDAN